MILIENNRQVVQNTVSLEELTGPRYKGAWSVSLASTPQRSTGGWVVTVGRGVALPEEHGSWKSGR